MTLFSYLFESQTFSFTLCQYFVLSAGLCLFALLFLSLSPYCSSFLYFSHLVCLCVCIATEDVVQRKLLWEAVEGRGYNSVMLEMNSVSEDFIMKEKTLPKRGKRSSFSSVIPTNHLKSRKETKLWLHQRLLLATVASLCGWIIFCIDFYTGRKIPPPPNFHRSVKEMSLLNTSNHNTHAPNCNPWQLMTLALTEWHHNISRVLMQTFN